MKREKIFPFLHFSPFFLFAFFAVSPFLRLLRLINKLFHCLAYIFRSLFNGIVGGIQNDVDFSSWNCFLHVFTHVQWNVRISVAPNNQCWDLELLQVIRGFFFECSIKVQLLYLFYECDPSARVILVRREILRDQRVWHRRWFVNRATQHPLEKPVPT